MNKNSLVLILLLVLIGIGAYAAIGWQRGHALAPEGLPATPVSGGGLIINSVLLPGDTAPLPGSVPAGRDP